MSDADSCVHAARATSAAPCQGDRSALSGRPCSPAQRLDRPRYARTAVPCNAQGGANARGKQGPEWSASWQIRNCAGRSPSRRPLICALAACGELLLTEPSPPSQLEIRGTTLRHGG